MGEINITNLDYLVSNPANHSTFIWALSQSNEETIRGALQEIGDNHRKKTVIKALQAQLEKLQDIPSPEEKPTMKKQLPDVPVSAAEKTDPTLHMEMETLRAEREDLLSAEDEQKERETLIAQAHQIIGRVQANTLMAKFANVSNLVHLKNIKESKIYRDLPMVGTWDKYCNYLGLSRQKVDEDLMNLAAFGEDFLTTCQQFSLGYRDLRQLRQLKYDGESFKMSDDGKTVVIEGSAINLSDDAAPEIEAALEKLLEKNKTLRERNTKLEKDLKGAVKEETAGLESEKKALLERVKSLEVYEPKKLDEDAFVKQFDEVHAHMSRLASSIRAVMAMDDLQEYPSAMARVEGYVEGCSYLANELREIWADQCMFENK